METGAVPKAVTSCRGGTPKARPHLKNHGAVLDTRNVVCQQHCCTLPHERLPQGGGGGGGVGLGCPHLPGHTGAGWEEIQNRSLADRSAATQAFRLAAFGPCGESLPVPLMVTHWTVLGRPAAGAATGSGACEAHWLELTLALRPRLTFGEIT
jgi:hypothetical protein